MGRSEQITELERRAADLARETAPIGWRRLDLGCRATIAEQQITLTVLTADGRPETVEPTDALRDALAELRRVHYLSEQGTWFSMTFFVEPDAASPLYNYDEDPGWDPPLPADAWRRDQVVLPRDGAKMPGWLRDRIEGREPGHDRDTAVPPLNQAEQMDLLSNRFTTLIADQAPPLWHKVFGYYQATGGHEEFPPLMVMRADGTRADWTPPPAAAVLLDRLRAGTHAFRGSTWFRIDFEVLYDETSVRCRASFTSDREPAWNTLPPAREIRRELERFPTDQIPEWMLRLAGDAAADAEPPPDEPVAGVRRARVFDGIGPDGENPSVSRPPVDPAERGPLADYLRRCPVVLAARSFAPDLLDPARPERVPLTFHTDGTWVWSGAVGYYLAEHGVPPEPDLVAHVRARGFRVPQVADEAMDAATAAVTGEKPPERVVAEPPRPNPAKWLERVARRLDDLGVVPSAYRIGTAEDDAWCLIPEGDGWSVFKQVGGDRLKEVRFDAADDAAAHLLGRLLLIPPRDDAGPVPAIAPLPGEPPLTLFRDPKPLRLPAGTIVDRYGEPDGNVVYARDTPFPERSLPAEWERRPYRAYRLLRPLWTLSGTAVPWFDQPGGGTAYVFAASLDALVAEGALARES
ncbi:glycohydrolase toxin TNT-related protein [Actinomadura rayongensis]|uniref:Glycohydrolase toxin TNT-related protein n=1 Tax=Actinomadura rayongensis TaxID=1429076 RepID=A0A6I4W3H1_9ACTN|nr:glycohydrolase toxin TNT-related protein [Actinomadura rayongensis]